MAAVSYDDFLNQYYGQLSSIGLPEDLWECLYDKLFPEIVYDAGNAFVFHENEQSSKGITLCAKKLMQKCSDVFIIDHAWSSDGSSVAKKQLETIPQLLSRMQSMFGIVDFEDDETNEINSEDDIDSVNLICELCNCPADQARAALQEQRGLLIDAIMKVRFGENSKSKEGIEEEECSFEEFKLAMESCVPEGSCQDVSENYLRKMYENFRASKNKSAGAAMTSNYSWTDNSDDGFIEVNVAISKKIHADQIKSILRPKHWHLEITGKDTLIDGDLHESVIVDESWWTIESEGVLTMYMKKGKEHGELWTELVEGERQLSPFEIEEVRWKTELQTKAEIKDVLDEMWKHNQTYRVSSSSKLASPPTPIWYVMDEVGTAIGHSSTPNFACHPLFVLSKGIAVSIIWPLKDLEAGDMVTRNFIQPTGFKESSENFRARVSIFEMVDRNFEMNEPLEKVPAKQQNGTETVYTFKDAFVNSSLERGKVFFCDFIPDKDLEVTVSLFGCSVTNEIKTADFILTKRLLNCEDISKHAMVNHFDGEEILFSKNSVNSAIIDRFGSTRWHHQTYNLLEDFPKVLHESKRSFYNQPWVLRSDDSDQVDIRPIVSTDLLRISRVIESGLTLASKYIINGARYNKRCFTLSFVVYVRSMLPAEFYVHKKPYIRMAKDRFHSSALLNEFETTSLTSERPQQNVLESGDREDFSLFVKDIEDVSSKGKLGKSWKDVETDLFESIGMVMSSVGSRISMPGNTSFGLFGIDFLLDSNLCPIFLGFNRTPYFEEKNVLKDIISALLCTDTSKGLLGGNSFVKFSAD